MAVAVVAGGGFFLFWPATRGPGLPAIPTNQLDAAAASLVQESLGKVRAAPQSGAAWGRLGAVLRSYEFRNEAARCLAEAERLDPREPRWPYLHGLLLAYQSQAEARVKLSRAVELCGNEPEAPRLRLARLLAEAGRWEEAQGHLKEQLRAKPESAPALLALAQIAQVRGELAEAVALAGRCTTNAYTARAAWTLLGALHQRQGDTNAAQLSSRKAAAAAADVPAPDPFEAEFRAVRNDARSLSDQAQQSLMAGRPGDASPLVTRLVLEHPQFSETWLLKGRMEYLQAQPVQAEASLRRHLELDPQSVNGHFQLGMALLAQHRYPAAAESFERATRLKADFGPAFFNLGFALAKAGRTAEAVQPFREAIRHSPERIDSYILLADLYLQLGRKSDAADLERKARELAPADRRLPVLREKIERP